MVSVPIFIAGLALAAVLSRRVNKTRIEDGGLKMANTRTSIIHPSILHPPHLHRRPDRRRKIRNRPALAEQLGGEIISVDSMQVYRGLDIGTAKPSPADRARVPHHLIDICDLTGSFDAAQFIRLAQRPWRKSSRAAACRFFAAAPDFISRRFLSGLGEAPPADQNCAPNWKPRHLENLLAELRERDPAAYEKIDKQNPRRVIRAVEVIRLTGKKFSEQRAEWKQGHASVHAVQSHFFCFTRQPADLHAHQRPRGRNVRARPGGRDARIAQARPRAKQDGDAGHRLPAGGGTFARRAPLAETIELVKIRTRQFAKRQLTWFRRQLDPEWIELKPDESRPTNWRITSGSKTEYDRAKAVWRHGGAGRLRKLWNFVRESGGRGDGGARKPFCHLVCRAGDFAVVESGGIRPAGDAVFQRVALRPGGFDEATGRVFLSVWVFFSRGAGIEEGVPGAG
jgi:tRNA dimethylallyltransferase